MVWMVIWIVLMMFWIVFGCYMTYDPAQPKGLVNVVIPWLCVLLLGLMVFGAVGGYAPPAVHH